MDRMDAFDDWFFWTWKMRLPCCWENGELQVMFISRSPLLNQETLKRHCGLTNLATGMVFANPWAMFQHLSKARFHPGTGNLHPFPRDPNESVESPCVDDDDADTKTVTARFISVASRYHYSHETMRHF